MVLTVSLMESTCRQSHTGIQEQTEKSDSSHTLPCRNEPKCTYREPRPLPPPSTMCLPSKDLASQHYVPPSPRTYRELGLFHVELLRIQLLPLPLI